MRSALVLAILAATTSVASAQSGRSYGYGSNSSSNYVQPHVRSNGDYVGGHYRTNPNSTTLDNYGTSGNYNPYSGTTGRRKSGLYD